MNFQHFKIQYIFFQINIFQDWQLNYFYVEKTQNFSNVEMFTNKN